MKDHMIRLNDEAYTKIVEKRAEYIRMAKKSITVSETVIWLIMDHQRLLTQLAEKLKNDK